MHNKLTSIAFLSRETDLIQETKPFRWNCTKVLLVSTSKLVTLKVFVRGYTLFYKKKV